MAQPSRFVDHEVQISRYVKHVVRDHFQDGYWSRLRGDYLSCHKFERATRTRPSFGRESFECSARHIPIHHLECPCCKGSRTSKSNRPSCSNDVNLPTI
jgi:hypothetical protein